MKGLSAQSKGAGSIADHESSRQRGHTAASLRGLGVFLRLHVVDVSQKREIQREKDIQPCLNVHLSRIKGAISAVEGGDPRDAVDAVSSSRVYKLPSLVWRRVSIHALRWERE